MLAHLTTLEEPNKKIENNNNLNLNKIESNEKKTNSILKNSNNKNINIIVPDVHPPNQKIQSEIHPKFIIDNSENVINVPNINIENNNKSNLKSSKKEENYKYDGSILKSNIIDENNKVSIKDSNLPKINKKIPLSSSKIETSPKKIKLNNENLGDSINIGIKGKKN